MTSMSKDPADKEHGFRASDGRVWAGLIPAMSLPFLGSLFYFVILSDHVLARALYGMTKVLLVVWPVVAMRCLMQERVRWADLWPRSSVRLLWVGLASGIGILLLMWLAQRGPLGRIVGESAPAIRAKVESLGVLDHYWAFGLFLALGHSFLEEYYWRWFVFGRLRRVLPRGWAHVVAGVCFSAHHIVVASQYFPGGWAWLLGGLTGVGGILWSWMYERQNSLAGPWVSHVLADLGILGMGHQILFGSWW